MMLDAVVDFWQAAAVAAVASCSLVDCSLAFSVAMAAAAAEESWRREWVTAVAVLQRPSTHADLHADKSILVAADVAVSCSMADCYLVLEIAADAVVVHLLVIAVVPHQHLVRLLLQHLVQLLPQLVADVERQSTLADVVVDA